VLIDENTAPGVHEAQCIFCRSKLQYISDQDVAERNYMRVVFDLLTNQQSGSQKGAKSDVAEELSPSPG
jgi:hypothetical protein